MGERKKVLFVATVVKTHIMEFHLPYLRFFQERGWETDVAAGNDYENPADCIIPYCDRFFEVPFERNPLKLGNVRAYRRLKALIDSGGYDIIHCHTPVGGALTRLAARDARKRGTRVIYTAHGFHFYRGAPLLNWFVYYPAEKWLSRYTDTLITINREDYAAAQRFYAGEVRYVHGVGVDTRRFAPTVDRARKRAELGLRDSDFALLSVGELIPRKNHAVVLRALSELKKSGKLNNIRYLVCGQGILREKLEALARELEISGAVRFLGYRDDIAEICAVCDLFVFPSKQEGLPVALMEAMSTGLPCVCSEIRGNSDLIRNGENGCLVRSTPQTFANVIWELYEDKDMGVRFAQRAHDEIGKYDIDVVMREMEAAYFPNQKL